MIARLRPVLATLLGVLAVLFTVLSIDARAVRSLVLDTDRFVAVLGPVIDDAEVQVAVADALATTVVAELPEPGLLAWLPDGVGEKAGERARNVAASVVRDQARALLSSDAAQSVWDTTLRVSHAQIVATLRDSESAAVQVDGEDRLVLDVTPVWDATRTKLTDIGLPQALLPEREVEIDLADGASVASVQRAVALFDAVATWLLPLGLLAAAGCVLVARRRRFAGYWLAAAVGIAAGAHAIAFALAPRLLSATIGEAGALLRGVVTRTLAPPMWTFSALVAGCAVVIAALIWTGRRTEREQRGQLESDPPTD